MVKKKEESEGKAEIADKKDAAPAKKQPKEIVVTFHGGDAEESPVTPANEPEVSSEDDLAKPVDVKMQSEESEIPEENIEMSADKSEKLDIRDFSDDDKESEEEYVDKLSEVDEDIDTEISEITGPEESVVDVEKTEDKTIEDAIKEDEERKKSSQPTVNDDLDEVVDEIVNEESDQLLQAQDEELDYQNAPEPPTGLKHRLLNALKTWWEVRTLRYGTFVLVFFGFVAFALFPTTRYMALNAVGVRVSVSMSVVDSKTRLPLKNIPVNLQGVEMKSDDEGTVQFSDLKVGKTKLLIDKLGYAEYSKDLVLGWGSNPLGEQPLTATGAQYVFVLHDWLSDKPIADAEASSGEDIAKADEAGKVTLTVGVDSDAAEATITADGYRTEVFKLNELSREEKVVKLVPAKKHVFVSNRDGRYDLYKIDVDGKNEQLLLGATGNEREIPFVVPHQEREYVAYISSRDGDKNQDNFVLDGLFIVDVANGETYKVTRSAQLQVVGWSGNKLIYFAVVEGASAGNSERSKLFSYDLDSKERIELATSNYFNDVKLVDNTVYYAVSSYAVPKSQAKLFSVQVDGSEKQTIVEDQVWSIIRQDYDTLVFNAVDQQWYEQKINGEIKKLDTEPANRVSRVYKSSPDGKRSSWVDVRDGKGVLLIYDVEAGSEKTVMTEPGLTDPVYWINDQYVIFRKSTNQESADYVLNLDGGPVMKISDVLGNRSRYFY